MLRKKLQAYLDKSSLEIFLEPRDGLEQLPVVPVRKYYDPATQILSDIPKLSLASDGSHVIAEYWPVDLKSSPVIAEKVELQKQALQQNVYLLYKLVSALVERQLMTENVSDPRVMETPLPKEDIIRLRKILQVLEE